MCDCFHIAFPNWHAASSGAGAGHRLRGPEPGTEDNSICDEASQFTEGERPRPQGSSPVEEFPESDKYGDSDKEFEAEHEPHQKSGKKPKKSGLGSIFDKRSTPKMSKLKEAPSPEAGVIVKTAKDGCAEGLVYSGGGKDGIFIKEVVPESPAYKNLRLKEGDQVLSATVYFDDIPYEDAIQILEHAQAYKVKLCLKRKPDTTEIEGAIDSDVIPEDEVHPPEMRDSGKKRRGDARISWPKFPTLGRGKKSRFTRSHSSSEADEQRKLELSPTTSDTESPIKSQDALKGKKKHKIKLPGLKRGRISSSEDTDAQNIQTEEMISPECLESPTGKTKDMEDEVNAGEKVELRERETEKVELICLDSTLKTTDSTAVLEEQEIPSATASPDGKKKKKERSELKLKLLGRDKKHKVKSSPKRLKTLGASLDKTDERENEKSDTALRGDTENVTTEADVPKMSSSKSSQMELRLPKVEIDISDVGMICKSTHDKKGKGKEEKRPKTGFKLPKVGLGDVPTEEIIKIGASVESKSKEKDDAYERFPKSIELPKREDIEIPGMEDISKMTKDFKEPKAPLATIPDTELQAETLQLSIDVDSVKEAVSKLPGYKLPKVDTSGVPIPHEITVIDANAQRISVKTPTKSKHESKSAFSESSKTTVKLPKVTAGVQGGENQAENEASVKRLESQCEDVTISTRAIIFQTIEVEKVQKENITWSTDSGDTPKELNIKIETPEVMLPDSKPSIKISEFKMDLTKSSEKKYDKVQGERTIFLPEDKLPDVTTSSISQQFEASIKDIDDILKVQCDEQKGSGGGKVTKSPIKEKGGKFKMPNVGISIPKVKGSKVEESEGVSVLDSESDPILRMKTQQTESDREAKWGITLKSPENNMPREKQDISLSGENVEVGGMKITESTYEVDGQSGKFKLPKLGIKIPKIKGDVGLPKKDIELTLPDVNVEIPATDITCGKIESSMREQKVDEKKTETEVKGPSLEGEIEGKAGKFKMLKPGSKVLKIKGPEFDIGLSKNTGDGEQPKGKVDVELPNISGPSSPEKKTIKAEAEFDGQGSKFKMPKLGITMPKMKGPEIDGNLSKRGVEVTVPEDNIRPIESFSKEEVSTPHVDDAKSKACAEIDFADSALDGKEGKFKLPKLGISFPKAVGTESDLSETGKDVRAKDNNAEMTEPTINSTIGKVEIPDVQTEIETPSVDINSLKVKINIKTPGVQSPEADTALEGQSGKFKIPRFTINIPTVTGPEDDTNSLKKSVGAALPEDKIEVESKVSKVDVDLKPSKDDVNLEGQSVTFKMPKFGIKMPKIKGPEIDISIPKKEVKSSAIKADIKLPETPKVDVSCTELDIDLPDLKIEAGKADVPDVEVKSHNKTKIKASVVDVSVKDDSLSKFKMPSLGFSVPKKDVNVTVPEVKAEVALPETEFRDLSGTNDVKKPDVEASERASPLKFKMPTLKLPKFGGSVEEKDSEIEIKEPDVSITVPQTKVDLPEVKAEVHLPKTEVSLDKVVIEQPSALEVDAKFKKPRFSLPRFSFSKQSAPAQEFEISDPEVVTTQSEGKNELEVDTDLKAPEPEPPIDTQSSIFKLPKFGIAIPKVSAPKIDLTLSNKDVEMTLPVAELDGKISNVENEFSTEVEMRAPDLNIETTAKEGSPSKLKMPTFKLPKFGATTSESENKIEGKDIPQVDVALPGVAADVPLIDRDVKAQSDELDTEQPSGFELDAKFKKPRFSLPKFSFSKQSASGPEVDISAPEVNIPQKEGKVEVKGELDVKAPALESQIDGKEGKFKLPQFGISVPKISGPEIDLSLSKREGEFALPEAKVEGKLTGVEIKAPSFEAEVKAPDIKIQTKTKEGSPSKLKMPTFKLPKFGATTSESEIKIEGKDIPQVDVALPGVAADVQLIDRDVKAQSDELDTEQPSGFELDAKFKKPRFSLPKFSFSKQSASGPEVDISAPEVTIPQKEGKVEVKGELDVKAPALESQIDGKEGKFKLPQFGISVPKISGPEIDLSLSKREGEFALPEAKVEGKLTGVEVKAPSFEAEVKAPDMKIETKTKEGSPSKLKMPTFKFPKFGASIPEAEIKVDGADVSEDVDIPKIKAEVNLPKVDVKDPLGDLEQPSALEMDMKLKKPRFSLPRFSFSKQSVPAPDVDIDIDAPEVHAPQPEGRVEVKGDMKEKAPELEAQIDGHGSKFTLPKFGITMPKISGPDIDLSLSKKDSTVTSPEAKAQNDAEVKAPSIEAEVKAPDIKIEMKAKEGSPSKLKMPTFKFPKFGASIPEAEIKVDGAEVSVPEVVDVPNVKAEVNLPDVDVKDQSGELELQQLSGLEMDAKFKKSRFSLPRFSFSKQSMPAPEVEINAPEVNIPQTEGKVDFRGEADVKAPELQAQIAGEGSKFKLPKFGIAMPKISGPDIDLSLSKKDVDVTLPASKAEGSLSGVEVKAPSIEAEVSVPEIKVETKTKEGSPSKLKMPTFKLPKFGSSIPEAELKVDVADVTGPRVNVDIPDVKAEVNLPDIDVKVPSGEIVVEQPSGLELDAKYRKPRFSLPRFSFSKQNVSAPDVDINTPEVNASQTEGKIDVEDKRDVMAPEHEAQIDGKENRFKLPKFGIAMPKVSGPQIDLSLSKKDYEGTLPKATVEGKMPGVENEGPSIEEEFKAPNLNIETKLKEGSPSKLKMPTFKFPKFGVSIPEAEIKVDGADVSVPEVADVPNVKAEINLPHVNVKDQSGELELQQPSGLEMDAKFKKPRFSLPKFSFSLPSAPPLEVDINPPEVNIPQTEGKAEVKGEIDVNASELEPQENKFKLPKFGITMPKMSGPEIDLSLSKKDVEVTLPEAEFDSKFPRVEVKSESFEAEVKAADTKVEAKTKEGSPSKLKMPTFKFPKFGASIPEAEIKIDEMNAAMPKVDVDLPNVKAEVNLPDVDVKVPSGEIVVEQPSGLELDAKFKKPRFSLPRFSFSKQSTPAPDIDIKSPEVTFPQTEGKVEVKGEIEANAPELAAQVDGQGSKFKLPKFGIAMPKISGPEIDVNSSKTNVEVTLPEAKIEGILLSGEIKAPSLEVEVNESGMNEETKTKEESPSKLKMPLFKLPKFGATVPEVEMKVDVADVTYPQVNVDRPDVKAEVNLPDIDVKVPSGEIVVEQPSGLELDAKFKKPRFSLPRFSFSKQSTPAPDVDIKSPEVTIPQAEGKVEVKGEIDMKAPELEPQIDGQGSIFKLPKFGIAMPKVSAQEIGLGFSKKDVEGTLPVSTVEGNLPVEAKAHSIEAEAKVLKVENKTKEESPSKLKMPKFNFPKFGASIQGGEINVDGVEEPVPHIDSTEVNAKAQIQAPSVEVKEQLSGLETDATYKKPRFTLPRLSFSKQSVPVMEVDINASEVNILELENNVEEKGETDVKSPELDGQGSKFKFPKFGVTIPKISAPEIDLSISKKNVESKLPDSKAERNLTDAEVLVPWVETEVKAPEIKLDSKQTEGSPSKLKMPSFKMPKFGFTSSNVSDDCKDIKHDVTEGAQIAKDDCLAADNKVCETEEKRGRFKMPSLGFSTAIPDLTQKETGSSNVEIKNIQEEFDMKTDETESTNAEDSPSKFKIPMFKRPKFGTAAQIDRETSEVNVNVSNENVKDEMVEVKAEVIESKGSWSLGKISFSKPNVATPETDIKLSQVDLDPESKKEIQTQHKKSLASAVEGKPSSEAEIKMKKPRFSLPKISFGKQASIETEADVNIPGVEASLPAITVDTKQTDKGQKIEGDIDTEESRFKMPKFGISLPKVKGPEIDLSLSKKDANINSPETKIRTMSPEAEESEVPLVTTQKASWTFSGFSFSKPAVNVTVESDKVDTNDLKDESSTQDLEKHFANEEDESAMEPETKAKFSLPKFSFSKTLAKDLAIPEKNLAVEISLSEGEVKIRESDPKGEAKHLGHDVTTEGDTKECESKSKDIGGSPLKFKIPVFNMPKIGVTTNVNAGSSDTSKTTEETLHIAKEGQTVTIATESLTDMKIETSVKLPIEKITTHGQKSSTPDPETPHAETLSSPSKFKLPSFKMPRLSFSKPKSEDEYNSAESKIEENPLESDSKAESKSPNRKLSSFGETLKNIDVEFDAPNLPEESMGSQVEDQTDQKQQEPLKETKKEAIKSPERTGWFKFPSFGLSSPTDPAKSQLKEDKIVSKTPTDLTENEELSPTCSIQSSEAFADISSTMISETVACSLSSPTKVRVRYSDPDSAELFEEMHPNVVMSTTKTDVILVEPNLPEKVMILSSGLSSSSEDTVKLESGKIHIVTSNIQVTPESQQAKMFSLHTEAADLLSGPGSWTVTDSHSSKGTFTESLTVRESASESKEVVITKQITRVVTTTESISDETATSIKQLKDSVHTEKMRFFEAAEK